MKFKQVMKTFGINLGIIICFGIVILLITITIIRIVD